jgi:hypothetical protein
MKPRILVFDTESAIISAIVDSLAARFAEMGWNVKITFSYVASTITLVSDNIRIDKDGRYRWPIGIKIEGNKVLVGRQSRTVGWLLRPQTYDLSDPSFDPANLADIVAKFVDQ